jgi:hypothetical protein
VGERPNVTCFEGMDERMRVIRHFPIVLAAVIGVLLAGCGPRYQTFTSYAPPEDEAGRQCLAQCLSNRQLCRQNAQVHTQQCRIAAQTEAQIENFRRLAEYQAGIGRSHRKHQGTPEAPDTVSPNYGPCNGEAATAEAHCVADHDLCYQNCGGQVAYTTQCVANCE